MFDEKSEKSAKKIVLKIFFGKSGLYQLQGTVGQNAQKSVIT